VQRSVERGQRTCVGLRDSAEQDRVGEGGAEREDDREDVQREDDFVELDGYQHEADPIGPGGT
jgi:hypothetical protein